MGVQAYQILSTGLVPNTTGLGLNLSQQLPSIIYIETSDALATVVTTGYLTKSKQDFQIPYSNQMMALVYVTDNGGETVWLTVLVAGTAPAYTYSLVAISEPGSIATPTVANQIAYATNTLGALAASGVATALFNAGNISAGTSGTAGVLESYPATASKGALILKGVANTGNTNVTISNAAFGQATVMSFADVGAATGNFLDTGVALVSGNFPENSGTAGLMIDSGVSVASLVASQALAASAAQTATVTLSATQVIAAYATPEVLIPAVAGKVAVVISAIVYTASTGHTAFATGVAPIIQYGDTAHGAGTIAVGAGLVTGDITAAASQIRTLGPAASTTYTGITNTDITFSCTTAYTAGTGSTVTFQLVYTYLTATV